MSAQIQAVNFARHRLHTILKNRDAGERREGYLHHWSADCCWAADASMPNKKSKSTDARAAAWSREAVASRRLRTPAARRARTSIAERHQVTAANIARPHGPGLMHDDADLSS